MSKICSNCKKEVSSSNWNYNKKICSNCNTKNYYLNLSNKEKRKEYEKSKSYKESVKKYRNSKKGKIALKKFDNSYKGKLNKLNKRLRRKENLNNIIHSFTPKDWLRLKKETKGYCPKCKKQVGVDRLEIDHIIPISKAEKGQIYTINDVQPLCTKCNKTKGNRLIKKYEVGKMNSTKKNGTLTPICKIILTKLKETPEGLRASILTKTLDKPRRTIYNNLKKLEQLDLIKNIYPIWKIGTTQGNPLKMAHLLKNNKIQLHDLSFTIRLMKTPEWWDKRQNKLLKINDLRQLRWGNNNYHQIKRDDFIIQIFTNSMIFICQKHYWGDDSYDCFIQGAKDFLKAYYYIEELFKFKFFPDGIPNVSVRSQHHVNINDIIAKKCKKENKRLKVIVKNKLRLWVDFSEPFGMEAGHKNYAVEDMKRYAPYIEDIIINNPPKPSKIAHNQENLNNQMNNTWSAINQVTQNQQMFAKNIETHMNVLKSMDHTLKAIRYRLGKKQVRTEIHQKNLKEFM